MRRRKGGGIGTVTTSSPVNVAARGVRTAAARAVVTGTEATSPRLLVRTSPRDRADWVHKVSGGREAPVAETA
jgi:hypothetical protein